MNRKKPSKSKNPFHKSAPKSNDVAEVYPMRLNKYIAKSGVCSRRKAADLVKAGKVTLNGAVVLEPYVMVEETDKVIYDGELLKLESKRIYLLLNKPKGVITTTSDERDRRTVLDLLNEKGKERLFPVGRLDRNTTGLLLITNDGDLAKKLSHPSHKVKKEYMVYLDRPLEAKHFNMINEGLTLEDGLAPVKTLEFPDPSDLSTVKIALVIGRNRIVRRIFEHLQYEVKRLDRTYFAGLTKKNLPRSRYRHLTPREVIMLKHFT